ncbi:MAG: hypothetical protein ACRDPH_10830 [Marmoricola sp.]
MAGERAVRYRPPSTACPGAGVAPALAGVIELVGPAGAGKTTLARVLASDPGTSIGLDTGRLRSAAGLASTLPWLTEARFSSRGRFWSRDELRSLAYLTGWPSDPSLRDGAGLSVLDHGPVFRLASLCVHGPPMASTPAFAQLWQRLARQWSGLLDAVVWLDAPDDVLLARITGRNRPHRIRGAVPSHARRFLDGYRTAYRATLAEVATGPCRLIELDTATCSPQALAERVRVEVTASPSRRQPR